MIAAFLQMALHCRCSLGGGNFGRARGGADMSGTFIVQCSNAFPLDAFGQVGVIGAGDL
jgi:hypothetical protein